MGATPQKDYQYLNNDYIRYNICSAWFLDIRISTCFGSALFWFQPPLNIVIVLIVKSYFIIFIIALLICQK